jgi:flavodoxin
MKTVITYVSVRHGNTEKIAKAMASVLQAELLKPEEVSADTVSKIDLFGVGSGIYNKKHHETLFAMVDKLPSANGKRAFLFSTSGYGEKRVDKYHEPLRSKMVAKGFKIIGEFTSLGFNNEGMLRLSGGVNKGRPNEEDLKNSEDFARNLQKKMSS